MTPKKFKCCICGEIVSGYGNNPYPVKSKGRCCDFCDNTEVIPTRIYLALSFANKNKN